MYRGQEECIDSIVCESCGTPTKKAHFRDSYADAGTFGIVCMDVYCEECFEQLDDPEKSKFGHLEFG